MECYFLMSKQKRNCTLGGHGPRSCADPIYRRTTLVQTGTSSEAKAGRSSAWAHNAQFLESVESLAKERHPPHSTMTDQTVGEHHRDTPKKVCSTHPKNRSTAIKNLRRKRETLLALTKKARAKLAAMSRRKQLGGKCLCRRRAGSRSLPAERTVCSRTQRSMGPTPSA